MSAQRIPGTVLVWLSGLLLLFTACGVQARLPENLPPALQPWIDWVLADSPEHSCPFLYTGAGRSCAWPSGLSLEVDPAGGRFSQQWRIYREGWLTLPGGHGQWPLQVTANGEAVAVTAHEGAPAVYLPAGEYELAGRFEWNDMPKSLPLPAAVGLVELVVAGRPVAFPVIDPANGMLWIQKVRPGDEAGRLEDRLQVQRFRRILDDLPMLVETRLRLQVSGRQREVLIDHPMLAGAIPLRVDSPLPARLEPDGRLRVQLRPGEWWLSVHSRFPGEVLELKAPPDAIEIWSFQAVSALRLVEVSGAPTVDPRQTLMPAEWRGLPAYRMEPGGRLVFSVKRHGDPQPEPNRLEISREAWLDFDGGGYTVRDRISGSMTSGWRLDTLPEYRLGRVLLQGRPQFITRLAGQEGAGVEVRRGQVDLLGVGRLASPIDRLDAVGWRQDFTQADFTLHLPPGWRLLSASGMDNIPATWLQRWTLLDLFMVLITTLAVARLWGWRWLVPALLTLALLWHEPGAPRYVWLNLVAAVALLRVVPQASRFHRVLQAYWALSLFALLVIALPFMVEQIRVGVYPQLERPYQAMVSPAHQPRTVQPRLEQDAGVMESPAGHAADVLARKLEAPGGPVSSLAAPALPKGGGAARSIVEFDPQAIVQTGPGLPQWQWNRVHFSWNGPVQQGQTIHLIYLSPGQNLLLNLLRMALLLVLAARFVGRAEIGRWLPGRTAAPLLLVALLLPAPPDASAGDIPGPALLEQLKARLLEAPGCAPACADIPGMTLTASGDRLQLDLQVHAQAEVAMPLPGRADHWLPDSVTRNGAAVLLYRDHRGVLWTLLPPGVHRLQLSGSLPQRATVQVPLALRPQRVRAELQGWSLDGVDEQGAPAAQLQLTRKQVAPGPASKTAAALEPAALPPFVRIERTLHLGLEWTVQTRVLRVSPMGTAVVLRVPLLAGESVTTPDIRVENGKALVQLPASARETGWSSVLAQGDILLQASRQSDWVERWLLDVSPIWHVTAEGIAVVHHTDAQRQWLPEWRPWPGQSLRLKISRPAGVAGRSLTIESAELRLSPGLRASDSRLELAIRASQGGRHSLRLPPDARLQSVVIDGQAQPIRQQGQVVELPIHPGLQRIALAWRSPEAITSLLRTPAIDLGTAAVNNRLAVSLGPDRWILFLHGPAMGPAVLWWGVLAVVLIAALILDRLPFSPLRHYQWVLLALGLTQTELFVPLLVGGWLLALGLRRRLPMPAEASRFNLVQLGLVFWTVLALLTLVVSIQQGLLGRPDMLVAGNQSSATLLNWYQDRSDGLFPDARVLSLPLLAYRLLMLAWALWLAFALLRWLRWGWDCFTRGGMWRRLERRPKSDKPSVKTPGSVTDEP